MRSKIIYGVIAICLALGVGFVVGTVSAQRTPKPVKPTGGWTADGKYIDGEGKPVEYTWCYPGTWTPVPSSDPPRWTCRGGSVYGTGEIKGPGAPQ